MNQYSLVPGTWNKPKAPPQKVDSDGRFQFDENRQYDGPDRITGNILLFTPGNEQAIGDLLIKLEGDAHQIRYKRTQQKIANQPNKKIARWRRCSPVSPLDCATRVSCALSDMG